MSDLRNGRGGMSRNECGCGSSAKRFTSLVVLFIRISGSSARDWIAAAAVTTTKTISCRHLRYHVANSATMFSAPLPCASNQSLHRLVRERVWLRPPRRCRRPIVWSSLLGSYQSLSTHSSSQSFGSLVWHMPPSIQCGACLLQWSNGALLMTPKHSRVRNVGWMGMMSFGGTCDTYIASSSTGDGARAT